MYWLAFALAFVCAVGCQSNVDRDLIARDQRLQEDHLYAMQDYLSQYQQLVCRYRAENASLRRQLNEVRAATLGEPAPEPQPMTPRQPNWPASEKGPTIETPTAPGSEKKPATPPQIETPDVPPLKSSTLNNGDRYRAGGTNESVASYDAPGGGGLTATVGRMGVNDSLTSASFRKPHAPSSKDVLLSGEVVANDNGGGPRIVVDVDPFNRSVSSVPFRGKVSLMLLSTDSHGAQKKLARWDFGPGDVTSAVDATVNERALRFHVELPAGTKIDGATELWVRLLPSGGGKLLSHVAVDLSRPGHFSSRTDKTSPAEESVVATNYEESTPAPSDVSASLNEGKWATAEPGKPANLPSQGDDASSGWKATNEPPPGAVASATPVVQVHEKQQQQSKAGPTSREASRAAAEVAQVPAWAPERPGGTSIVSRPTWSPTR
ncbi:MAG TPA: hypothetical protein VHE81_06280 [Lacipirellulaceae bacterium]|nr:hypothetical protein [Lacipirellulaceae bacterium]